MLLPPGLGACNNGHAKAFPKDDFARTISTTIQHNQGLRFRLPVYRGDFPKRRAFLLQRETSVRTVLDCSDVSRISIACSKEKKNNVSIDVVACQNYRRKMGSIESFLGFFSIDKVNDDIGHPLRSKQQKGLRSPLLFNIVVDTLPILIARELRAVPMMY